MEEKFYSVDEVNTHSIFQFIRLEENPTTGYGWQYEVADESVAVVFYMFACRYIFHMLLS